MTSGIVGQLSICGREFLLLGEQGVFPAHTTRQKRAIVSQAGRVCIMAGVPGSLVVPNVAHPFTSDDVVCHVDAHLTFLRLPMTVVPSSMLSAGHVSSK